MPLTLEGTAQNLPRCQDCWKSQTWPIPLWRVRPLSRLSSRFCCRASVLLPRSDVYVVARELAAAIERLDALLEESIYDQKDNSLLRSAERHALP